MKSKIALVALLAFNFFCMTAEEKKDEDYSYLKKIIKSDEEWKEQLTEEEFKITRLKGTEAPFCGMLHDNKKPGIYYCVCCALPLFTSKQKFISGTGWPSFFSPFNEKHVVTHLDSSHGMQRAEILCARCDAHLGHVFSDGPKPTGLRYCINSDSLSFMQDSSLSEQKNDIRHATFGAGSFWHAEAKFAKLKGVVETSAGFMGGKTPYPSYEEVCTDKTGHAEVVRIEYDPQQISYESLLNAFWKMHDPVSLNKQGRNVGLQYRSVIFFYDKEQEKNALESKEELEKSRTDKKKIATEIRSAGEFYRAEDYHQMFFKKNPEMQ